MRSLVPSCVLLLLSGSLGLTEAKSAPPSSVSFDIATAPSWVKTIGWEPPQAGKRDADQGGIFYMILDRQDNVGAGSSYYHEAREITSETGVQNGAAITVSFDPSYQKLVFHFIRLWRGGTPGNRLDRSQIKLFQREKDMESFLYDGAYTAQCELEDVRVGDVIEFAYSVKGDNPVKNGRYSRLFYVDWNVPVGRAVTRIIYPTGRKLTFSNKNRMVTPVITTRGEITEWYCDERDVRERRTDPDVPVDYDPNGWVQITEFNTWQELVEWARQLYEIDVPLSAELQAEITKLLAISRDEERILAALRFVQEEVRYLGIESGVSSHRPTASSEVLRRRFGDCKDKALLLTTLLRRSGIDAAPALVSSSLRGSVAERLPAPADFNHVIVQVTNSGATHWLDATRTGQRGPLSQINVDDFRWALVLRPGARELTAFAPPRDSLPRKEIAEKYRIMAPGETSELDVVSEYHGLLAEKHRAFFRESTREKIEKQYVQYYARRFPGVRVRQSLVYEEMPDKNGCKTKEFYSIPDIWTKNDDESYELSLFPGEVEEAMGSASSSQRDDPLALNHPINITEEIDARMFADWPVNAKDQAETNAFYRYSEKIKGRGSRLQFTFSYETCADRVPTADLPAYNARLLKLKDTMGYRLTYRPSADLWTKDNFLSQVNWPIAVLAGCVLTMGMFLSAWIIYKSKLPVPLPPSPLAVHPVEGIGGWLILVAIHHILRPILFMINLVKLVPTVLHLESWRVLTQQGQASFHPYWAPVLIFELCYNLLCLVFSGLLLVLFFQKRALWRWYYVAFLLTLVVGVGLDTYFARQIPAAGGELAGEIRDLVGVIVAATIWIPYCLVSRRVKATFRY